MHEQPSSCQRIMEELAEAILFVSPGDDLSPVAELLDQIETAVPEHRAVRGLLGACREHLARAGQEDAAAADEAVAALQEEVQRLQECLLAAPEPATPAVESALAGTVGRQFSLPEWVDENVFRDFIANQSDSITDVEHEILQIEEGDQTALADLKRRVHTLKGEAGLIGLETLEHLCHVVEELLETPERARQAVNLLLAFKDWVADALVAYAAYRLPEVSSDELVRAMEAVGTAVPAIPAAPAAPIAAIPAPALAARKPHSWDADTIELMQEFLAEGEDGLTQADDILLQAEDGRAGDEQINAAFRVFHTIKGVAGFLQLDETSHLAHAAESLLNKIREGRAALAGRNLDLMFAAAAHLRHSLEALREAIQCGLQPCPVAGIPALVERLLQATEEDGDAVAAAPAAAPVRAPEAAMAAEPVATPPPEPAGEDDPGESAAAEPGAGSAKTTRLKEVVKIDLERVDNLVDLIGELVIVDSMIGNSLDQLGANVGNTLRNQVAQMSKITRDLQGIATSMRMVPVRGVFQKMARMVRDLSQKSGKPVRAILEGEATELDRSMVEQISDPLVHMIRNSIDHGIESPDVRQATGKPARGTIRLSAFHEGGRIVIEIADDGKGLNRDAILAKARQKGLIAEGQVLSDQEAYQLIFAPGFSTAEKVTEISGRGVGMDVVLRNVEAMHGKITLDSRPGRGTTFSIQLPLTMAIIEGTLIRVGRERFILPTLSMYESIRPTGNMVFSVAGKGEMVHLRNETIPLYRLGRLLGIAEAGDDPAEALIAVVECHGEKVSLLVDEVIDQQQVVIKGMGVTLGGTRYISGAAIMSDGRVGLILNPDEIPALANH